jgi:hypothetical protein
LPEETFRSPMLGEKTFGFSRDEIGQHSLDSSAMYPRGPLPYTEGSSAFQEPEIG